MIRINVVAEGQSEMYFVKQTLNTYFAGNRILDARCVLTSTDRRSNYEHRGGLSGYQKAKNDIIRWAKSDQTAYVTTMFDFFQLPDDFPGFAEAMSFTDHEKSVNILEHWLYRDICAALPGITDRRFIPYIQLHEFEALLYTDLTVLKEDYLNDKDRKAIDALRNNTQGIPPEKVNHGIESAPSKRLLKAIQYKKGSAPSQWLQQITIDRIRAACPHFSSWINTLKSLKEL